MAETIFDVGTTEALANSTNTDNRFVVNIDNGNMDLYFEGNTIPINSNCLRGEWILDDTQTSPAYLKIDKGLFFGSQYSLYNSILWGNAEDDTQMSSMIFIDQNILINKVNQISSVEKAIMLSFDHFKHGVSEDYIYPGFIINCQEEGVTQLNTIGTDCNSTIFQHQDKTNITLTNDTIQFGININNSELYGYGFGIIKFQDNTQYGLLTFYKPTILHNIMVLEEQTEEFTEEALLAQAVNKGYVDTKLAALEARIVALEI